MTEHSRVLKLSDCKSPEHNPLLGYELSLFEKGHKVIAGIDEVGYGSLAGPVTVAACILDPSIPVADLKDSKKFSSHKKRSRVAQDIRDSAVAYWIAHRPNTLIDEIGVVETLQQAQLECIQNLSVAPDKILIDGTPYQTLLGLDEEYIVKGDATVACIAAASILAKVARDELMIEFAKENPDYDYYELESNKGYGSLAHRNAIKKYGLTPIHRKSYCANLV